jgi:uncharacterized membrane protein (DUF485 family)
MNLALAITELALALIFFTVAVQRWKMGLPWSASSSLALGLYFGRIGLLYLGRWLEIDTFESAVDRSLILTNALLVVASMLLTSLEAHRANARNRHDRDA